MPKDRDLVSVIIPCKIPIYLEECLCSVLRQSYKRIEIIVVVDSEAASFENKYGRQFPMVRFIKNSLNHGPARARNIGIKNAHGKFICFLDADDYWESNFLKDSINVLMNDSFCIGTLCFSKKIFMPGFSVNGKIKLLLFNLLKDSLLLLNGNYLDLSSPFLCQISHMLFDRKRISKILFDPRMKFCEDWYFIINALERGRISIIRRKLICFRYSVKSNTFSQSNKVLITKILYYRKIINEILRRFGSSVYLKMFIFYSENFLIKNA